MTKVENICEKKSVSRHVTPAMRSEIVLCVAL